MKSVLSIAGSDPSGGAGIQADLKTFQYFDVYGMAAVSLLTVQNTLGIKEVLVIHPDKIKSQILTVLEDISPNAVKLGALGHGPAVLAVAESLKSYQGPVVADPVMLSKNGAPLLMKEAVAVYKQKILPLAFLVTPNLAEAEALCGFEVQNLEQMKKAAESIVLMGAKNVLVKGGHLEGSEAADVLFDGKDFEIFKAEKIVSQNTHGVGCTLASAIAANLALGKELSLAVKIAKDYVLKAIQSAPQIGKGNGPINHHV
ncbi:MAG TPA: bifunctional hydroxymethylpyrimidine kinase/phosphomethylpyrimidine kinase [Candidatus Omnitrophota bacterium]|nr:bifunctional hydroxymethylpyrimidine kinase/phosphomethylpyrimidine kinase [Candidatus Omnitrophota bacterium]